MSKPAQYSHHRHSRWGHVYCDDCKLVTTLMDVCLMYIYMMWLQHLGGTLNYRTATYNFVLLPTLPLPSPIPFILPTSLPPSLLPSGTGKSLTCGEVAARTGLRPVDVGQLAKDNNFFEGWDEQYQCPILDEDKVQRDTTERLSRITLLHP